MLAAGATTFHVARRLASRAHDITGNHTRLPRSPQHWRINSSIRVLCCPGAIIRRKAMCSARRRLPASMVMKPTARSWARQVSAPAASTMPDDELEPLWRDGEAGCGSNHRRRPYQVRPARAEGIRALEDIDRLVTDRQPEGALAAALRDAGPKLCCPTLRKAKLCHA